MFKICVYVPEKSVETVKQVLFDAGAGKMGNYDSCCWQSEGIGQFRPLDGSNPTIGSQGEVEYVREIKIELLCADELLAGVIQTLKHNHPYEEPAFDVWQLYET